MTIRAGFSGPRQVRPGVYVRNAELTIEASSCRDRPGGGMPVYDPPRRAQLTVVFDGQEGAVVEMAQRLWAFLGYDVGTADAEGSSGPVVRSDAPQATPDAPEALPAGMRTLPPPGGLL